MGDLVTAVRGVGEQREGGTIEWKLAYKELNNVIDHIRQLVLRAGTVFHNVGHSIRN